MMDDNNEAYSEKEDDQLYNMSVKLHYRILHY